MLQDNPELKSKIGQLWNKFWSGGISNPLTAIEQITYLLFMKRLDDLDLKKQADAQFTGESYVSKFSGEPWLPQEHRDKLNRAKTKKEKEAVLTDFGIPRLTLRWGEFTNYPADEMLVHVRDKVFPFLKDPNGTASNFTHHMRNAALSITKPSLLVEATKSIDEIFVLIERDEKESNNTFQDIQGDVYEYLLDEIASAGKNGQFRTPRQIIKLITELLQPKLGDMIADPACGSSGFLLSAYQYIVTELAKKSAVENKLALNLVVDEDGFARTSVAAGLVEKTKKILQESLVGYDIDNTMVRLGLMNLMMHGIDEPKIDYKDTLSKSFNEENKYHVIMANPPFTGNIDKGDINEKFRLNTTKSELLFLENIYRMLRVGGSAGVVVPQGVLFGSGKAYKSLRQMLIERCDLRAVISMPSGVFKPYTGVSTAILIFTKVYEITEIVGEPATKFTWFYDMHSDGRSLDDKRIRLKLPDGSNDYGDLQDIIAKYQSRESVNDIENRKITCDHKCFMVPREEIVSEGFDLSIARYKEDVFEEIEYEPSSVILQRLIEAEIGEIDEKSITKMKSGMVRELLDLKEMIK